MATNPAMACSSCRAPMAPGARFCGICGRASDASVGAAPPMPPPMPPGGLGGIPLAGDTFEQVALPVPVEQAAALLPATITLASGKITEQSPGRVRFTISRWWWGTQYLCEAAVAPAPGGSTVTVSMTLDKQRMIVGAIVALVFAVLFAVASILMLILVIACSAWEYTDMKGPRLQKFRGLIAQGLRDAAGAAPQMAAAPGYAPPPPAYAPAAPAASPTEQLRTLAEQHQRGLLSAEEFDRAKAAVLAAMTGGAR